ncbi:MAG: radical SAM family heme chaperone HemW [Vampirovibrionales bacterium]
MHVYIHIPFCQSRCIYCDFYVELAKYGGIEAFVSALCQEIEYRWDGRDDLTPIQTLYLGGGTPSLLTGSQIQQILNTLQRYTPLALDAEITMECNPAQIVSPIEDYMIAGINRFSLGVQSLNNTELQKLSRQHRLTDVQRCIEDFYVAGAMNVGIDLMVNTPLQTPETWQHTLTTLSRWNLKHVSIYGLQVEEGTPLARLVQHPSNPYPLPDEATEQELERITLAWALEHQFRRYEVSNYAKIGWESRHNMAYWRQASWWAFGPSAHGFIDGVRYENQADLTTYLKNPLVEKRFTVSSAERLENVLIFALRTRYGVNLFDLQRQLNQAQNTALFAWLKPWLADGYLQLDEVKGRLWVPQEHWNLLHELLYPLPKLLSND